MRDAWPVLAFDAWRDTGQPMRNLDSPRRVAQRPLPSMMMPT